MSQTFSMFQKNLEKFWVIENFCNIAKFRKIKAKTTESQLFSMLKFLDGHALWYLKNLNKQNKVVKNNENRAQKGFVQFQLVWENPYN